jgi:hypothetical protein
VDAPVLKPVDGGHPDHMVAAWYDLRAALKAEAEQEAAAHV